MLNAYRQRAASPFVSKTAPAQVKPAGWMRWAVAAAAAILVVSAMASLRLLSTDSSEVGKQEPHTSRPTPVSSPEQAVEATAEDGGEIRSAPAVENSGQRFVSTQPFSPSSTGRRRELMRNAGVRSGRIRNASNTESPTNANEEIATDFLPLTYDNNFSQLDDGQIVRVELPRSALHSFGLPVNAERGRERVKADVLLGHDGVARAIRFVR